MEQHLKETPSKHSYYVSEDTGEFLAENPHTIDRDQAAYFVEHFPHLSFRCEECDYTGSRAHPTTDCTSAPDAVVYDCPNTSCKERVQISPMVDAPAIQKEDTPEIDELASL